MDRSYWLIGLCGAERNYMVCSEHISSEIRHLQHEVTAGLSHVIESGCGQSDIDRYGDCVMCEDERDHSGDPMVAAKLAMEG